MLKKSSYLVYVYFLLFFISGISGLIYESIWSQYLRQFLGHAAYSQTLVLVIYMGGMALGSWITGLGTKKIRNLLLAYAAVQITIGTLAIVFHNLFLGYLDFSFERMIPLLDKPLLITAYKWFTASVIILPQSVLLGATFPLMAAGILRRFPGLDGYKVSMIYFVNTFGASLGVLISGFYFVKVSGLRGAMIAGGLIDIFVGICVLFLCFKDSPFWHKETRGPDVVTKQRTVPLHRVTIHDKRNYLYPLLFISGATAAASFIYEIGWIRMLSLVLGSSTHSFELMLSAFILGLALGSFFVRNRLDKIRNIPQFLGVVQVIMGASALMTLFTYSNMFEFMAFILDGLDKTDQGYLLYNIFSHFICMIVMLPSTICAGMVIPLVIHLLYKKGFGEEVIGKVYAVNTFGGIIGVVVAVWVLMPLVGLKFLITIGGIIDIGIGLYILSRFKETRLGILRTALNPFCIVIVLVTLAFSRIDPVLISSGVFRYGTISRQKKVVGHKDGRTASITLFKSGDNLVLSTNGKPDASVGMKEEYSTDEYTMALLGVLPLCVKEQTSNAAVIGMGAGMTAHFLLYDPRIEQVDIIEIEPAMANLARKIGHKVENTFQDKRCRIYFEDAKTFFSAQNRTYDLIISEPSNPWVSGVSSLFSREFFSLAKKHLNDDGVLVQWFHKYEADVSILVSILKALNESFPKYEMYAAGSDLIIIAAKDSNTDISLKRDVFEIGALSESLVKMGFASLDDFRMIRYADQEFLNTFVNTYDYPANSDYHSFVDLNAVKYRFLGKNVGELDDLREFIVPVKKIAHQDTHYVSLNPHRTIPELYNLKEILDAKLLAQQLVMSLQTSDTVKEATSASVFILDHLFAMPHRITFNQVQSAIIQVLQKTLPFLSADEMREIWEVIEFKTSSKEYSPQEKLWLSYFRALCIYDMPALKSLSLALMPEDKIADHYSNQMLIASLFMAAYCLEDTTGLDTVWGRYELKNSPPVILRMARALAMKDR